MSAMRPADDRVEATPPAGTAARRARQQQQQRDAATRRRRAPAGAAAGGAGPTPARRELDPDRLAAMEEERDFLLRSLEDLEREHDAGDVDDADYEALKDDYTARAAAVLRAIDARNVTMQAHRRARPQGRRWLVVAAVLVVGVLAGVAVAQSAGRREQGQTLTGDIRTTTREQLFQAQQLFAQGKLLDAIKVYDQVLASQPANAEALTYKGWLLRLTANQSTDETDRKVLLGRAVALLDQAVRADPGYADARVFRASILNALGRPAEALADLDKLQPGAVPDMLQGLVGQLRSSIEANLRGAPGTSVAPTAAP